MSLFYFPFGAAPDDKNSRIAPAFFRSDLDAADDYRTLELNTSTHWERIGLENFTPPPPPDSSKGILAMAEDQNKTDSFAIDWSNTGDTLTIKITKNKDDKPKPKPRPKKKK